MTIAEIETMPDEMLTPAQIAPIIGSNPDTIRWMARTAPENLGFPVVIIGNRVKIPRRPFLKFMGVKE